MHFCWIFLYKQKCFFSVITNNLNWETGAWQKKGGGVFEGG